MKVSRGKLCIKCRKDEWGAPTAKHNGYRCLPCGRRYNKRYETINRKKVSRKSRGWARHHKGERASTSQRYNDKVWAEFFEQYGAQCINCGETDKASLTVGHLNGDGAAHRRELGRSGFVNRLRTKGWPKDKGIATQCANCQLRQVRVRWTDPLHPFSR